MKKFKEPKTSYLITVYRNPKKSDHRWGWYIQTPKNEPRRTILYCHDYAHRNSGAFSRLTAFIQARRKLKKYLNPEPRKQISKVYWY